MWMKLFSIVWFLVLPAILLIAGTVIIGKAIIWFIRVGVMLYHQNKDKPNG